MTFDSIIINPSVSQSSHSVFNLLGVVVKQCEILPCAARCLWSPAGPLIPLFAPRFQQRNIRIRLTPRFCEIISQLFLSKKNATNKAGKKESKLKNKIVLVVSIALQTFASKGNDPLSQITVDIATISGLEGMLLRPITTDFNIPGDELRFVVLFS